MVAQIWPKLPHVICVSIYATYAANLTEIADVGQQVRPMNWNRNGATENARHENTGRSKMQDLKMRDMKMRDQIAGKS